MKKKILEEIKRRKAELERNLVLSDEEIRSRLIELDSLRLYIIKLT